MVKQFCLSPALVRSGFLPACALAMALLLAGCGSLRLYSETRDKQGQAATQAWGDVDLKGFFQTERDNQGKLLDAELAGSSKLADANRETEIRVLAALPLAGLPAHYDAELRKVAASDPADVPEALKTAATALNLQTLQSADLDRNLSFLQAMGVPSFGCPALTGEDPSTLDAWKQKNPELARQARVRLDSAKQLCGQIEADRKDVFEALARIKSGALSNAAKDLGVAEQRARQRQEEVSAAKASYSKALKAYDDVLAQAKAGTSTVDKAKELAGKLSGALDGVQAVGGLLSEQFVSQERINHIDELLTSLKAGTGLDAEDAPKAEVAISMFPKIADDIRAIEQARKGRAAIPLLIQRDIEQARLNSANARLQMEQRALELRRTLVAVQLDRARSLVKAKDEATKMPAASQAMTLAKAWDGLGPSDRRALLDSTTQYLDAFSRQAVLAEAIETRRQALTYGASIDLSEVNAAMWSSLIAATVTQSAEFSAQGIKADDIEKILNLLGIFYIGRGVNK